MGQLYPAEQVDEVRSNQRGCNGAAPNVFQWNLLDGLAGELADGLEVINVLPVGVWPTGYSKILLKDRSWVSGGIAGREIGGVNLPFVKQYTRYRKAKRLLKRMDGQDTELLIYSAYMPFLKAIYRLPKSIKVTVIVTDLPEYYELGKATLLEQTLRKIQNRMVYRYLNRVDRFVVLTEQMTEPLRVGNRPWLRIEGICNAKACQAAPEAVDTKAILYSGALQYQYGIKNLLKAFASLKDPSLALWICGSGEAEKEIQELSRQDPRVKFYGFCSQQEVAQLREKAAVLVNPRTNEGEYTKYSFPSKTMEYMASGKPVVMYKLDGIPEEYDQYLFYADPEDAVRGLKTALEEVLAHYEEATRKASLAQAFVLENKNAQRQAQKITDFIRTHP